MAYVAYEEVTICGVTVPKGHQLGMGTVYPHFNPEHWHRPTEYLPERFDPESELYFKPGTRERRHPKSYNAFSCGKRKCLAQVFSMISAKVVLSLMLCKLDYEVTEELMSKTMPRFDTFSNTDLIIKIK